MKIYLFIISIILYSYNLLFADEIYLKNSEIIKGEVLQITEKNVEYREYNGHPLLIIPVDQIQKIVYGKEIINEEPTSTNEKQFTADVKEIIYTNRYLDSYLKFFLIGGISFIDGNITDKEQKIFNKNKKMFYSDDGSYSLNYYSFPRGFELDYLLPTLTHKTRTYGLTGFNLGLKTRYTFTTLHQRATSSEFFEQKYTGILLKYYTISAGPELNMAFSGESSRFDFIWQIYSLAGYIPYGKLNAATCVREAYANEGTVKYESSETKTSITGYSLTGGMGFYWSGNRAFPLVLGFNIFYTHTEIKFKKAVPVYDGAKRSSFNEKGILISVGTHFWSVN